MAFLKANKAINEFFSNINANDMITKKTLNLIDNEAGRVGKSISSKISNLIKSGNLDEVGEAARSQQNITEAILKDRTQAIEGGITDTMSQFYNYGGKTSDLVKGYFGIGKGNKLTSAQRNARYAPIVGIGGASMGASAYSRYKKGGTLTRNEKGERDIVGVPLL